MPKAIYSHLFIFSFFNVGDHTKLFPEKELKCNTYSCFENKYIFLTREKGINKAFSQIKKDYLNNSIVKINCHQLTHAVGRTSAEKELNLSLLFSKGDSLCFSGYYHGVMEQYLFEHNLSDLNDVCEGFGKAQSFESYNCNHGIGHGLMYISKNELFESLDKCNSLDQSSKRSQCYSGVFMENVLADNKNHFTKFLNTSDIFFPCNSVEDKYKFSCYNIQTNFAYKNLKDYKKMFNACESAANYSHSCYMGIGRIIAGLHIDDLNKIKANCELGNNIEKKNNCIFGAVRVLVLFYSDDKEAKRFCDIISDKSKPQCKNYLKFISSSLN